MKNYIAKIYLIFFSLGICIYGSCGRIIKNKNVPDDISVSAISSTTATIQGKWESLEGPTLNEYGFVWGITGDLSPDDRQYTYSIQGEPDLTTFEHELTNLTPDTEYFVLIYGKTKNKTVKGNIESFTTHTDPCAGSPADPDMTNAFLPDNGTSIPQGTTYSLTNRTNNISDNICAITNPADTSDTWMVVEYRIDNFSSWDTVYSQFFPIDSILSGSFVEDQYNYLFNNAGQYRITTIADGLKKIGERVENNNNYTAGASGTNKMSVPEYSVDVTSNPAWDGLKAGFEPGEYVKVVRQRMK
ncbi:MAG: fibronectin type III domain-containing protein [Bacteroidia bacterium]|nr:fibronectin type III domain-containing protein [Bacteroidia bacterium]